LRVELKVRNTSSIVDVDDVKKNLAKNVCKGSVEECLEYTDANLVYCKTEQVFAIIMQMQFINVE
jgi:hypothetical protein